ncbi:hypothetical protein GF420_07550 [candidate division GN15 bacterium]|nr:hypothetical protein [candidate division GN15 bacterium]
MNKVVIVAVTMIVLLAAGASAQCPAHKAAEEGHGAFHTFHEVIAPAWHDAYPAKDYDALVAVGPEFKKAMLDLNAMRPEFPSERKTAHFNECRKELNELVEAYAAACEEGNQEKVYELMPDLHTAFERTAAATMPVHYKEFEALMVTLGLITDEHLPNDNAEGIVGSTETLVAKVNHLNEETLPHMLAWSKEDVLARFAKMQQIVAEMKKCCDEKDMEGYGEQAKALQAEAVDFRERYL